jgi:predicted regulator of Ras-like GTPase activity (Roadblock/LC7/MglB family)
MGFREHLESMVQGVEGGVAASIMGFDGIAVDTVESQVDAEASDLDIQTMLIEYSNILNQLRQAAEVLQSGNVTELSVNTEKLVTLMRLLSDEYFAVLAIAPRANYGKARYLLRVNAPKLAAEL